MVHNKKTKQVKLNVNNNPNKQKTYFKTAKLYSKIRNPPNANTTFALKKASHERDLKRISSALSSKAINVSTPLLLCLQSVQLYDPQTKQKLRFD